MCHAADSTPPAAPGAGEVSTANEVHLTSADGARFMAYEARPQRPTGRAAVILPDSRGLHAFYKTFARRLAGMGVAATAIDYFGRELPDGPREDGVETMLPLLERVSAQQVAADARAATDRLRADGAAAVFAVGFCFGGSQAWNQSAFDHDLAGCVGFYGSPNDCRPHLADMRVPMLLLVAGDDMLTPTSDFHAFDAELSEAGVPHEMTIYPGAPHGFFDSASSGQEEAGADAWRRLLDFIDRHAGAAQAPGAGESS